MRGLGLESRRDLDETGNFYYMSTGWVGFGWSTHLFSHFMDSNSFGICFWSHIGNRKKTMMAYILKLCQLAKLELVLCYDAMVDKSVRPLSGW